MPGLQPVTSNRGVPSHRCMTEALSNTRDLAACICNSSVPPPPQTEVINHCTVHRPSSRVSAIGQSAAFLPSPPPPPPTAQRTACRALLYIPPACLFFCLSYLPLCLLVQDPPFPFSSLWCVYMCQGLLLFRYRKRHLSYSQV